MKFNSVFGKQKVVLPVIHVESSEQAIENCRIALDSGAHGVFLINHHYLYEHLLEVYNSVRKIFPDAWIGLNFLDLSPYEAMLTTPLSVNGIWTDNALIDENKKDQPLANEVIKVIKSRKWKGLYFGGVAFKYQRNVDDLETSVKLSQKYLDVITTSGPGTGKSADLVKIQRMCKAARKFPLAIASGITPHNVDEYLPYTRAFLVATGISKSFTQLDEHLLKKLVRKVVG
ncbi:MAG: hypothetical protein KAI79_05000 [Bacteroidales bacterium]|nr:hypothetical protein [Bacteroidales bacterium]